MCDIDNFKGYDDTYRHSAGCDCLLKIAQTIKKSLRRPSDFCARYGGEEFVIIRPLTNAKGVLSVAMTIIENVRELGIPHEQSPLHCELRSVSVWRPPDYLRRPPMRP